ncbi:cytochrome c maturation protein CcmE [Paenibacillus sp. 32O-W]|uniref:cytochrome c maturation protein CcmE n=1 Tax=Paenibacillus sp. 32O-W TaxID=1695218 RepID=UPI0011A924B9|nr:cytochrome c maturation protein CcmE [Paenibacillus sp. 32O-W]
MKILKKYKTLWILSAVVLLAGAVYFSNIPLLAINSTGELSEYYSSIDELSQRADIIVQVEKTGGKSFKYEDVPFTLSQAKIQQSYKGSKPAGERIVILETGGIIHNIEYTFEGNKILRDKDRAVLFLKKYTGPVTNEDAYVILGVFQGKFKLGGKDGIIHSSDHLSKDLAKLRTKHELESLIRSH